MRIAQKPLLMNTGALPSAYKRLEYIQSSGYQYINTGYYANDNSVFELDYTIVDWDSSERIYSYPFGAHDLYSSSSLVMLCPTLSTLRSGTVYFGTSYFRNTPGGSKNVRYYVVYDKNGIAVNNSVVKTFSNVTPFQMQVPIYLFALSQKRSDGSVTYLNSAFQRVYSFKITEGGVLKRNFIPVKRKSNNKIGMYDTVTAEFYESRGTTSFTGA